EGEEGRFYVWTEEEIDALLTGTTVDRFKQAYGVTRDGNFPHEGKPSGLNVMHRVMNLPGWTEAEEPSFTRQKQTLLAAREKRIRPGREDMVLTDLNGLMIASITTAASEFGYVFSRSNDVPDQVRMRTAFDSQTPSANSVMIGVHARLFYATVDQHHTERANTLIQAFAGDVGSHYLQMGSYFNSFEFCTS